MQFNPLINLKKKLKEVCRKINMHLALSYVAHPPINNSLSCTKYKAYKIAFLALLAIESLFND